MMYLLIAYCVVFFFFKQKTAYEMRISDWSSDVCSSDLLRTPALIEMERQREIEFFRIETFGRARKGRCKTNRAKGEPVKLRVATGPVERESAQIAARTDGKGNQRLALKVEARRQTDGTPCTHPPDIGLASGAARRKHARQQ